MKPSDEIARRCVWIRLDANTEKPWERGGFRHSDLAGWAREHRSELARAAVILVRNWLKQGMPCGCATKGSFQEWARVTGGILEAASIHGFLGNESALFETATPNGQALRSFVAAWADANGEKEVTSAVLMPLASSAGPEDGAHADPNQWLGLLDDQLGDGNARARSINLGRILGASVDRVFAVPRENGAPQEWKICRGHVVKGTQRWHLSCSS